MKASPEDLSRVAGGLSALVIAKDEEDDLPECLDSLRGLADEIVVLVDDATTDRTEELARASGARTARRRFDDYESQRQAALELCGRQWVLWLDPDERVTPELREEIRERLSETTRRLAGFRIFFKVHFMGRQLRFGGLGREAHLRLFRREGARFAGGALHEGVRFDAGEVETLPAGAAIRHEPYADLSDYMEKLDRYTTLAARKRLAAGRRFHCWDHLRLPWQFFSRAVLKAGFLDGQPGLVWAGLSAFHSWIKYVKLEELRRAEKRI